MLAEQPGASALPCAPLPVPSPRDLSDAERYRRFGEELDALKQRTFGPRGRGRRHVRPPHEPLLARHGGRRARAHLLQPRARLVPARRRRALDPQAAPGDRDWPHRAARRLRPPARRRGVRVEDRSAGTRPSTRSRGATRTTSATTATPTWPAKDPDIHFGTVRLTEQTPARRPASPPARGRPRRHLPELHVLHRLARHRAERRLLRQRTAREARLPARPLEGERARGLEEGPAQVRAVLPLQLRPLAGARRPLVLEGAARQLARRDARATCTRPRPSSAGTSATT